MLQQSSMDRDSVHLRAADSVYPCVFLSEILKRTVPAEARSELVSLQGVKSRHDDEPRAHRVAAKPRQVFCILKK